HPVVVALRERIELVVVALCAGEGDAEKYGGGRVDAIHDTLDTELLGIDAAFLVDLRIAMETTGDLLLEGRIWQQVAGQLFDGELIEGQVSIQRVQHPVPVFPDLARGIDAVAIGIGVTRGVEPPAAPTLAVVRRSQKPVRQAFPGVGPRVAEELLHFDRFGWQAGQVETETPDEGGAVRLG